MVKAGGRLTGLSWPGAVSKRLLRGPLPRRSESAATRVRWDYATFTRTPGFEALNQSGWFRERKMARAGDGENRRARARW